MHNYMHKASALPNKNMLGMFPHNLESNHKYYQFNKLPTYFLTNP